MYEIHCSIIGRVQLVLFRDFVQRKARALRLYGTVQNLSNGSVEVVAQGDKQAINHLVAHITIGSFLSRVDTVHTIWKVPVVHFNTFTIKY